MPKKILITGATGLIGKRIVKELSKKGDQIKIISTNEQKAKFLFNDINSIEIYQNTSYDNPEKLKQILDGCDAIFNLAGANVGDKRWTEEYKKEIYNSRVETTKLLVQTIKLCDNKPECLINASGVGIYGFRGDEILNEDSSLGNDFLANLCKDWEAEAFHATKFNVRVAAVRAGIVLDKNEGALSQLMRPFKFFVGGPLGSGKQWFSWIHINDITNFYIFVLENKNIFGPINGTSPNPVSNKKISEMIGKVLKRPSIFPVPEFVLRIVVGEFAKNLVTGQRVYPKKALGHGFDFRFLYIEEALKDLLDKKA